MSENSRYTQDELDAIKFIPDNYTNSGKLFGGMISFDTAWELGTLIIGTLVLTSLFLKPFVDIRTVYGVRVGLILFFLIAHFAALNFFNGTILDFIKSYYNYRKRIKKYRYERRDNDYVVQQRKEKSKERRKKR